MPRVPTEGLSQCLSCEAYHFESILPFRENNSSEKEEKFELERVTSKLDR